MQIFLFLVFGIFSWAAEAAGTIQCLACPPGTYAGAGSTSCTTCPANHYCHAISGAPTSCPSGQVSSAGSTAKSDCIIPTATGLGGQYCAPTNRNECTPNAAWAGGSNGCQTSSTWTAWDCTTVGPSPYKARQNSYDTKASTWACKDSASVAPNAATDAQCRSGQYCWCVYSKSPDADFATFTGGAWSSWVRYGTYSSASDCAYRCAAICASVATWSNFGGAVSW
jgi:hypothetical protein